MKLQVNPPKNPVIEAAMLNALSQLHRCTCIYEIINQLNQNHLRGDLPKIGTELRNGEHSTVDLGVEPLERA